MIRLFSKLLMLYFCMTISINSGSWAIDSTTNIDLSTREKVTDSPCTLNDDKKFLCQNCTATVYCVIEEQVLNAYAYACNSDPILLHCGINGTSDSTCVDVASLPIPNIELSQCDCLFGTGPDPYTNHSYVFCSGGVTFNIDCGEQTYDENTQSCTVEQTTLAPVFTCDDLGPGVHPNGNDCNSYLVCQAPTGVPDTVNCLSGELFDTETMQCQDVPACFNCSGVSNGVHPDPIDCRGFSLCQDEQLLDQGKCEETEFFNATSEACQILSTVDPECPLYGDCFTNCTSVKSFFNLY